jgi:hypothetical protein
VRDDGLVREISHNAFANARCLAPTPAQWCDNLLALYADQLGGPAASRAMPAPLELANVLDGRG